MKKAMRTGFVTLALTVFLFAQARAENRTNPGFISVNAEGEVKIVPDEVVLTLGVETVNKELVIAKDENDQRVRKVIAAAKKLGVEEKYIQTDHISIEPRYKREWENRDFLGYFVNKNIAITLRDVSKFDALLSAALDGGANYVRGVDFRTTQLRKYRDQARSLAAKAAQEKANAIAGQLGETLGRPRSIQVHEPGLFYPYNCWGQKSGSQMMQNVVQEAPGSGAGGDTVALGQISVKAQVTISFDLE